MRLTVALIALTAALAASAQQPSGWPPAASHPVIALWPNAAPDATPAKAPEGDTAKASDNKIAGRPLNRLGNVSQPTLTLYQPTGKANGAAVVVFPGGGYSILAIDLEGTEVCDWLTVRGITCFILKYRVPDSGPYPKSPQALEDAQRALGIVRQHATEWHIDPDRVGVLGFSAGGHLAAALSTPLRQANLPGNRCGRISNPAVPDFAVVVYPGYLAWADKNFAFSSDIPVTAQTLRPSSPGGRRSGPRGETPPHTFSR